MHRLIRALATGLALAGPMGPAAPLSVAPLSALGLSAFALAGAGAAWAQTDVQPDYDKWNQQAVAIDTRLADTDTSDTALEIDREALVAARAQFQEAQRAATARADAVAQQLDALGPPPADGTTEAPEIADRRAALQEEVAQLRAPAVIAGEAYGRADALIRAIDAVLRDRQADALLQVWPSPVNPVNWPAAFDAVTKTGIGLSTELRRNITSEVRQENLRANLPLMAILTVVSLALLVQGRQIMERLTWRLSDSSSQAGRRVWSQLVSLGQLALPVLGLLGLTHVARLSGMMGPQLTAFATVIPEAGLAIYAALWFANVYFPQGRPSRYFNLTEAERTEARTYVKLFGWLLAARILLAGYIGDPPDAVKAVATFPLLVLGGVVLYRFGQIIRKHVKNVAVDEAADETLFRHRITGYLGLACMVIGGLAPVLAAVGYVQAATALIYPAATTLALIGAMLYLQNLFGEIYTTLTRGDDAAKDALVPVLVGFLIAAMALPVAALIWGARFSDLAEVWLKFRAGFNVAGVQISPTVFLTFAVVFALGYMATKFVQSALKSTILPKTRIDIGGQNALVSGVGYVGIVLASLLAITTAGINLSSLAILAGALSVGIGFGLQNIVQNFVSGIILLIERPISEGDWIEVGGVQGRVRAISVRSTRIETFDRNHVIVPNASLISGTVTNWTRFNLSGRLLQKVTVSGANDPAKVQAVLDEIARTPPMVILNPPPSVGLVSIEGGNPTYEMRLILRDVNFKGAVQNEVLNLILKRFGEEGIVFGVMGASKTIMADGDGTPYVLSGAVFGPGPAPGGEASAPPPPEPARMEGPAPASAPAAAPVSAAATPPAVPRPDGVPVTAV